MAVTSVIISMQKKILNTVRPVLVVSTKPAWSAVFWRSVIISGEESEIGDNIAAL